MPYNLYEYVNSSGKNLFKDWREGLDKPQQIKFAVKVNLLRTWPVGTELPPGLITGTSNGHILKMRVHGQVQLRPRLCKGPIDHGREFSFLVGAVEKNFKTVPHDVDSVASTRRQEIIEDQHLRRCAYVAS